MTQKATLAPVPVTPQTIDPLIRVRDLDVTFSGYRQVHAVRGVSFEVYPGEAVAIVGESGSGKSVTSRSLVGLAGPGSSVAATELSVVGRDAAKLTERQWRKIRGRQIGLVFQDALTSLDPLRTVGQEVAETLRQHGVVGRKQYRERVAELLTSVGITDPEVRASQYPHQLSGGLRQRALIASALAGEPQLLIADEPTTALDVTVQAQILNLLEDLRSAGTALLLVSHDLAVVSRIADRVLVMNEGQILESGPTSEVLSNPTHEYTKSLLAAVPSAATRGRRLSLVPPPKSNKQTTTAGDRPVLAANKLSKSFELPTGGTRAAVQDVTFELFPGQKLGIVGESGSGKSTLARLLLDLIHPDSGEVQLQGQPWGTGRQQRRAQRTQVQFVSQDPLGSFDPRYDVAEVISEPLAALPPRKRELRVAELLRLVGLDESFTHATPRRLSGGQRQRVSIARALALQPEVIICDEPVSALDVSIQAQVLDLLADLNAATGTALVFISHDLGVVHHLVDQVLVMRHGQVVEAGDVDDVFHHPLHPYTQELVAAVPRLPNTSTASKSTTATLTA